jgi:hypothetical protein
MLGGRSLTGFKEMDISIESLPLCFDCRMCHLLHAAEKGVRRLEAVSTRRLGEIFAHSARKVAAIDFFGAVLALAGSTLLVVCSLPPSTIPIFTKLARLDLGWPRLCLELGSGCGNTGSRCRGLSAVHHLAMERH